MPTIHRERNYKFRFYSLEDNEPPHIHVWSPNGQMKVWLNDDLEVEECYDIPLHEWSKILKIIKEKKLEFIKKYHEFNQWTNN